MYRGGRNVLKHAPRLLCSHMPSAGPPTGWTLPFADSGSSSSVGSVRFEVSAESSDMGAWSSTTTGPSCACPEFEGTVAAAASALSSAPLRILFQDLRPTAPVARSPVARVLASPKGTRSAAVHAAEAALEPRAVGRSVLAEHRHPDTLQRPTPPAASRPRRTPYASACRAPRKNGKRARIRVARWGFEVAGVDADCSWRRTRKKAVSSGQTARFKCARAANGPVKSPAHVLTRKYAGGGRA